MAGATSPAGRPSHGPNGLSRRSSSAERGRTLLHEHPQRDRPWASPSDRGTVPALRVASSGSQGRELGYELLHTSFELRSDLPDGRHLPAGGIVNHPA